MIKYHIPIIFSSSVDAGALNRSSDGSRFTVSLEKPLFIPKEANYCWVVCQAAEIWHTTPNVFTGVNDKMYFEDSGGPLVITLPQGLYDTGLINAEIDRQLLASGRSIDVVELTGNHATQKTSLYIEELGATIDFTQPDTFRGLAGFDSILITAPSAEYTITSGSEANFNQIDFFSIHCDIVSHGLRINNKFTQSVAQVLLEAPAGSVILHQPDNPPEIPCPSLIGSKKNLINCWLTDQNGKSVDTAGDNYSFRLVIYYVVK